MVGKSSGQLIIWDTLRYDATDAFVRNFCIGLQGKWKSLDEPWIIGGNEVHEEDDRFKCVFIETNDKFFSAWNCLSVVSLVRQHSDHYPIVLKDDEKIFGPKLVKVFDEWLDMEGVDDLIREKWAECAGGSSRKDCILRNKLKNIKFSIKEKSMRLYGKLDKGIKFYKDLAHNLELKAESNVLNNVEMDQWRNVRKEWLHKDRVKTNMLKQKARVKWILEGDENTKTGHFIWNEEPSEIKDATLNHFKGLFEDKMTSRPSLEDLSYPSLSKDEAADLEAPISEDEVINAVKWFWDKAEYSRGCNASFVTLIPKKTNPLGLWDYRPNSLIGNYFKIIAKILSNRLRKVIPRLIGTEQSAFLKRRNIMEGSYCK
ncbi:uncharacterized protein [Rutidosis leptorrhynchoides]|uniref:uncharacterized protein n=1 Tax=Rutidosis leptorrhynchoides TaxID=125765 RepID=UPI003A99B23D